MVWWIVASVWAAERLNRARASASPTVAGAAPRPSSARAAGRRSQSTVGPNGNRTPLPPARSEADAASAHVTEPAPPVEQKCYRVALEIINAATEFSLGGTGTWVL